MDYSNIDYETKMHIMDSICEKVKNADPEAFANAYTLAQIAEYTESNLVPFNTEYGEMELDISYGRVEWNGTSMGGDSDLYWAVFTIKDKMKERVECAEIDYSEPEKFPILEEIPCKDEWLCR